MSPSLFNKTSFLNKVSEAYSFIKKETLAQVFSCEFCKISQNTFFTEHLQLAASGYLGNLDMISEKIVNLESLYFAPVEAC